MHFPTVERNVIWAFVLSILLFVSVLSRWLYLTDTITLYNRREKSFVPVDSVSIGEPLDPRHSPESSPEELRVRRKTPKLAALIKRSPRATKARIRIQERPWLQLDPEDDDFDRLLLTEAKVTWSLPVPSSGSTILSINLFVGQNLKIWPKRDLSNNIRCSIFIQRDERLNILRFYFSTSAP